LDASLALRRYSERARTARTLSKSPNITKLGNSPTAGGVMMVSTEWGAFDNGHAVLPLTPFDNKVNRESINPRF